MSLASQLIFPRKLIEAFLGIPSLGMTSRSLNHIIYLLYLQAKPSYSFINTTCYIIRYVIHVKSIAVCRAFPPFHRLQSDEWHHHSTKGEQTEIWVSFCFSSIWKTGFLSSLVPGVVPRVSYILIKYSTTELYPQPECFSFFFSERISLGSLGWLETNSLCGPGCPQTQICLPLLLKCST